MEAKMTINEIRAAISTDVALGKMAQETADHISSLLGLDWKEEQYRKRKDMDCFLEDLLELFEKYNASFVFTGNYKGEICINKLSCKGLRFGDVVYFNKDFIALLPKMWKRSKMVGKLNFTELTHIDEVRPILDAIGKVDRSSHTYVSDKQFNDMIRPYKSKSNANKQQDKI